MPDLFTEILLFDIGDVLGLFLEAKHSHPTSISHETSHIYVALYLELVANSVLPDFEVCGLVHIAGKNGKNIDFLLSENVN